MDIRKVKKLIELLEESGLAELEIQEGEEAIRLSRYSSTAPAPVAAPAPQALPAQPALGTPESVSEDDDSSEKIAGHAVTSPVVGTFYKSSSPTAKPFTSVGSKVSEGDTVCIIEAMKIFNQIPADKSGTVVAILKDDGDPVEYGEPLIIID
ncbi:MAG: acetyl-CoA carboxylase biotin carboxyl carrier protein [Gammaproteobacteria bacterium]|nr:MAG: acetyl-CoA carboxylase biotin carboxyl carrier protein [Gammaproteobacteria bacterium]RTZ60028.1 MAG: acetyl-CoA carboxylase biotin carboxyl carrier protein [Gammaproteobacteria bacterium]